MKRILTIAFCLLYVPSSLAQPTFAESLALSHSVVLVTTKFDGGTGRASGVVISEEYVATNCHVIANSSGVHIDKLQHGFYPKAIKADWKRDLCLLQFSQLPLKPVPMRDTATLQYEEPLFSLSFHRGGNVPQPSHGNVKALYNAQGGTIIQSDVQFHLGSSGGALFDEKFNLVGISTFKSPGRGNYYHIPVEWIKELMNAPATNDFNTMEVPFWAVPLVERPAFMRVVVPYQNKEWAALKDIAQKWVKAEPASTDAWYYLGLAEEGGGDIEVAKAHFKKSVSLNGRKLGALNALSRIAYLQKDKQALASLESAVRPLNQEDADEVANKLAQL